jgi:hypothetical protein
MRLERIRVKGPNQYKYWEQRDQMHHQTVIQSSVCVCVCVCVCVVGIKTAGKGRGQMNSKD